MVMINDDKFILFLAYFSFLESYFTPSAVFHPLPKFMTVAWDFRKENIANNPKMVHGSNSSLLQLLRITITLAKSETKYKLLRNTNDGYERTKIQETERN